MRERIFPASADGDSLHECVVRPLSPFRRDPRDDLIGIGDIAGLTMHAVLVVDEQLLAMCGFRVIDHLVHCRRAELDAWIPEFFQTLCFADIRIGHT